MNDIHDIGGMQGAGPVFSPASGVLAPGQSVLVTIMVPLTACTPGLFFIRGLINTHTIIWAC